MKIIKLASRGRGNQGGGPDIPEDIRKQARRWVVRLDGEGLSHTEKSDLAQWLERSSIHRRTFNDTAAAWMALDGLSSLMDRLRMLNTGDHNPGLLFTPPFAQPKYRYRLLVLLLAGTAIIALGAGLGGGLWGRDSGLAEYVTAVGEVRDISLPDQSGVSLNTNSRMSVAYRSKARIIDLQEGEAYFDVAKNPDVPFLVHAGNYVVKAVGTEFSVNNVNDDLDVIVTEGRVEVGPVEDTPGNITALVENVAEQADSLVPLSQGQKGVFSQATGSLESVHELENASITKSLAWRDGMLIFDNDSLESVVDQINRYTSARVVISDSSLSEIRFGGYFRIGDIDAVLAALREEFSISVEEVDEDLFYLSSPR